MLPSISKESAISKSIDSLSYKLDPSYVSVTISNKISELAVVSYDILNANKLDEKVEKLSIPSDKDIREVLKPNSKILVQIKKDSNDKKGAKVSTHISLPSKYIMLMPNTTIITISQKIEDKKQRERLLNIAKNNLPENTGAVVRTAAVNASDEQIIEDINKCLAKWKNIENKYNKTAVSKLVYESESIAEKIIIDLKLDKVITNSKAEFEKIKTTLEIEKMQDTKEELSKQENLLEMYDLNNKFMGYISK